ncbi:MAG: hypothetical protein ABIH37_05105 [archaeon]
MKNFKTKKAIILSYDTKTKFKDIDVIPFYEWFLKGNKIMKD